MATLKRHDGRKAGELRAVKITPGFIGRADGSCLIEAGRTRIVCTASVVSGVPEWMAGRGRGWLTAEYGMLPACGGPRKSRPIGKPDGRGTEIQRLIGRVMRQAVRTDRLGENTIYLDCDVLEADGGTRTASITGAYVALGLALRSAEAAGRCQSDALAAAVAAVSVGLVDSHPVVDLDYVEDCAADVDMNVAMTQSGKFIEVQASAERGLFDAAQLTAMLGLARRGIRQLFLLQQQALERGK